MVMHDTDNLLAARAFLVGVILAAIVGLSTSLLNIPFFTAYSSQIYAILVLIGLFVGYMNASGKESQTFMIAGAVLVIVSRFGMESVTGSLVGIGVGEVVTSIFRALLVLFVPATIVVTLKTVFSISRV